MPLSHRRDLLVLGLTLAAAGAPALAVAQTQAAPSSGQAVPGQRIPGSGVIRPPAHVDPGINRTRPPGVSGKETEPMPVIPPPGSPGGTPNVVPK